MAVNTILGLIICALKFPFNLAVPGSALRRDLALWPEIKAAMLKDPRMLDAMQRLATPGRTMHDLTNWLIELLRFLLKTWEQLHPDGKDWVASFVVKGLAALIVWPPLIIILIALFI
jgi:hypothetical protein